jgi:hypothetical protein
VPLDDALAAKASATAGNEQSRIEALTSEAALLFQQDQKEMGMGGNYYTGKHSEAPLTSPEARLARARLGRMLH